MPDYLFEPIETDPDVILAEFTDYIQTFFPNYDPTEAQLDYLIARFWSLKTAVLADMASRVQRGIYKYLGATILGIPPISAVEAEVALTVTALDSLGHTLDSDTVVGLRDAVGDLQLFTTLSNATIPNGSTSVTNVIARALIPGTNANNLSGSVELVEQIDWINPTGLTTVAPSSGGIDAETDEVYLNRLTTNFSLMTPRPVLAKDFALLARNIGGIWRAASLDNFLPGTNEVQRISHNYTGNGASGGTLSYGAQTTAALAFNSTAAQVQTALENLAAFEPGDIVATGGPWPAAIDITFGGRFAYTDATTITASAGTWTGGTTITITTPTPGVAPNLTAQRAVGVAGLDVAGAGINTTLKTQLDTYLQSLREQNFLVSVIDATPNRIQVSYTGVKFPAADATDVKAAGDAAVAAFFDPALWGIPEYPGDSRGFDRKTTVRIQDLYTVLNNVQGMDYISSLTFNVATGVAQDANDKTLLGIFPIPMINPVSGIVSTVS